VFKYGLDLTLDATGDLLNDNFCLSIEVATGFEFMNDFSTFDGVVHSPYALACGAVGMLDVTREIEVSFQVCPATSQSSPWLREAEIDKHLEEGCLALQLRKFVECCHGEADLRSERVLYACEEERLFVRGEKNVVPTALEPVEDELPIGHRIGPKYRGTVEMTDEPGKSADAEAVGITHVDSITKWP